MEWLGQHAIVTVPDHIDVCNASQIGEELLSVIKEDTMILLGPAQRIRNAEAAGPR